jgi:hypothetical protein
MQETRTNIGEDSGKSSDEDFTRFMEIFHFSTFELETQLIKSNDLDYITEDDLKDILIKLEEIQKMIFDGFVKSIKTCHSERGTSEESLLGSRQRFFFASLIRMTHMITFYETIIFGFIQKLKASKAES